MRACVVVYVYAHDVLAATTIFGEKLIGRVNRVSFFTFLFFLAWCVLSHIRYKEYDTPACVLSPDEHFYRMGRDRKRNREKASRCWEHDINVKRRSAYEQQARYMLMQRKPVFISITEPTHSLIPAHIHIFTQSHNIIDQLPYTIKQ